MDIKNIPSNWDRNDLNWNMAQNLLCNSKQPQPRGHLCFYSTFSLKNNDKEQPPSKFIIQELKTHMPHALQWFLNEMVTEDLCSEFFSLFENIFMAKFAKKGETNWTKTAGENSSFWAQCLFRLKTPQATEGMICHLRCNDALEGPGCGSRHWCWGERVDGWKQTKELINVASNTISHKNTCCFECISNGSFHINI